MHILPGTPFSLRGCRLTPWWFLGWFLPLALFLCGPPVGDSATPSRSGGRAPCWNKALSSRSRPKTHSGDAWCRWASVLFSLLLRLGFLLFSGLPFSVSVRFVFVSFRFVFVFDFVFVFVFRYSFSFSISFSFRFVLVSRFVFRFRLSFFVVVFRFLCFFPTLCVGVARF